MGLRTFREFEFVERRTCVGLLARRGGGDCGLGLAQQLSGGAQFLRINGSILRLGLQRRLEVAELLGVDATDARDGTDAARGTGLHTFGLANTLRRRRGDGLGPLAALPCSRGLLLDAFTALPRGGRLLFNRLAALTGSRGGLLNGFTTLPRGLGALFNGLGDLACGGGLLFNGFAALTGSLSSLLDRLTALASGSGGLFDGLTALPCGCSSLFDWFTTLATLACGLGGLLDRLTILRGRFDRLRDGLGGLRDRLRGLGLRGIDGLHAGSTTLLNSLDAFDVRGGGLLRRSGGTEETSGEEQSVHWERWVRTDFWNSFSTRCSYSANAVSSWCSAR